MMELNIVWGIRVIQDLRLFNSRLFSTDTIKSQKRKTANGSFEILTWQQIDAKEKEENFFPVLREVYKQKKSCVREVLMVFQRFISMKCTTVKRFIQ